MKYTVILPEAYQAHRASRLANPEFATHQEAVRNALAISKACGRGVEIQRSPKPYKSTEIVLHG